MTQSNFAAMTDEEPERYALDLLHRELGRDVFERFLRVAFPETSDYTRDRHKWLGHLTIEDIMQKLAAKATEDRAA